MSAIGGFFDLDPATSPAADSRFLEALSEGLARRGPDGASTLRRGGLGMVYRPFHTTPGSSRERQPVTGSEGHVLAMDGRLDRRQDLGSPPPSAQTDAEAVLGGWLRWGPSLPGRLVGDFALAAWEPSGQSPTGRLLLARDPGGSRPLYYSLRRRPDGGRRLLWASSLQALVHADGLDRDLDEAWIAGYLMSTIRCDRTPFREVRPLAPGSLLVADAGGLRLDFFWPGDRVREVRCSDDREYEERFLELLTEAVEVRMRARGPVFAELSGGVDSSSIVCLADRLLCGGRVDVPELHTSSSVFSEATTSDETPYIRLVEEQVGRPSHHIDDRDVPLLEGIGEIHLEVPTPTYSFLRRHQSAAGHLRRAGARVNLSGAGGDEIGYAEVWIPPQLEDLAGSGRWRDLLRELGCWSRELGEGRLKLAWLGAVLPWLPLPLQDRLSPLAKDTPEWIHPSLVRRTGIRGRTSLLAPGRAEASIPRPSARRRCALLRASIAGQVANHCHDWEMLGMEVRYPFLHRPLMEFSLGLPLDQLLRPGETRSLHRRALQGVLPPAIARRRDKRGPTEALLRALGRQWPQLHARFTGEALVYEAGFVDREPFLRSLDRARYGLPGASSVLRVLELEAWLRGEAEGRKVSAPPTGLRPPVEPIPETAAPAGVASGPGPAADASALRPSRSASAADR